MKRRAILLAILAAAAVLAAVDPALYEIRSVYVMPMRSGLDQHLASRLARVGQFQVVTDPQIADAVITDQVGQVFEERMKELYPPPPAAKPADDKAAKEKTETAASEGLIGGGVNRTTSFGRGNGNVFIVDRKSRRVIWSHFATAKYTTAHDQNRLADRIVDQLQDDMKKTEKK